MQAEEILKYWFGEPNESKSYLETRGKLWFGGGAQADEEIRTKFSGALNDAVEGKLSYWENEPESCLALVVLLDQFSLHIYRNQSKGYVLSELSLPVALRALGQGFPLEVHPVKRSFFYLPLEHAEDRDLQKRAVTLYRELARELKGTFWQDWADSSLDWAERHQLVVEKFGRFPHRNDALGRRSSLEELEFLKLGRPF